MHVLSWLMLVISAPASSIAVAADSPQVGPVPAELRESLKLDPFYAKHASAGGLPVLSSERVSDAALVEAASLINRMLAERDDVRQAMIEQEVRFVVMAPDEMTTDVPEQREMKPKKYWDARARGLGGKVCSCGEENLLNLPRDRYNAENILIHEFSHTIHNYGLKAVDPTFDVRLKQLFEKSTQSGLWADTYAATNHEEYWAEGVQDYFDCNSTRANAGVHNEVNTRDELRAYDPELFALVDEVFRQNPWRYARYDQRHDQTGGEPIGETPQGESAPASP